MYCENCGAKIPKNAKFCKKCGTAVDAENVNVKKKKPSLGVRIAIVFLTIVIGVCIGLAIVIVGSSASDGVEHTMQTDELEENVILDNDALKVTYQKCFEGSGISGVFYLQMKMENKTDREIWVYLDSASVNGSMVTPGSGVPTVISPGKSSTNPFILQGNLSDVHQLSFQIVCKDNETNENIFLSNIITVNVA